MVVESTYNWYWLVDGLIEAGYVLHLANTTAIKRTMDSSIVAMSRMLGIWRICSDSDFAGGAHHAQVHEGSQGSRSQNACNWWK